MALFTGADWNNENYEKDIRKMGLPLGKGIVLNPNEIQEALNGRLLCCNKKDPNKGKIQVAGWRAYLCPATLILSGNSQVGPSELIMMPRQAMEDLRDRFKENPATFTDAHQHGSAWALVNEAKAKLDIVAPEWEGRCAIVQFNPYELTFATQDVSKLKVEQMRRLLGYPEDHEGSWAELRRECNEAVARSLAHQPFTQALTAYATSARDAAAVRAFSQSVGDIFGGMPGVDAFRPSQERVAELIPPLQLKLRRDSN